MIEQHQPLADGLYQIGKGPTSLWLYVKDGVLHRAAEDEDWLVFGDAVNPGELRRIKPIERNKLHAGDMDLSMFRWGANIEKVEFFALFKTGAELVRSDGCHSRFCNLRRFAPLDRPLPPLKG